MVPGDGPGVYRRRLAVQPFRLSWLLSDDGPSAVGPYAKKPRYPGRPGRGSRSLAGAWGLAARTGRLRGGEQRPDLFGLIFREAHRATPRTVQRQPDFADPALASGVYVCLRCPAYHQGQPSILEASQENIHLGVSNTQGTSLLILSYHGTQ